ncbi:MAG: nucleotidyltransferase domain-containing protein [Nitrospirae bacterium]|nr:nucleotidyltransferase domain-containing protein [Nitrospirota bacterium]
MAKVNADVMDKARQFLLVLKEQGINIIAAYLFGSYAKGNPHKWSDIDIAVVSPDFSLSRFENSLFLMKIASKIDVSIEPVAYNPESFIDEDPLVWEIKKSGIPLEIKHGINR